MLTIHKFPLRGVDRQIVSLPIGCVPLSAGLDGDNQLCLWVMLDPDEKHLQGRTVIVLGTGRPATILEQQGKDAQFLGTVRDNRVPGMCFMWHVFII